MISLLWFLILLCIAVDIYIVLLLQALAEAIIYYIPLLFELIVKFTKKILFFYANSCALLGKEINVSIPIVAVENVFLCQRNIFIFCLIFSIILLIIKVIQCL